MKIALSIFSIIILLAGTVGINFDAHYCGGKKIKSGISFLPQNLSCGMHAKASDCTDESPEQFGQICCSNEHSGFQINDDYSKHKEHSLTTVSTAAVPAPVLSYDRIQYRDLKYEFIGYSPPPFSEDIIIKIQSFLI